MSRISVVIPTFNSQKTVVKSLMSVLNQTKKPNEIIVSDNRSTDKTFEIVRKFLEDVRNIECKLITCEIPGSGPNRNLAFAESSGDLIAFLDSDDVWDNNFIEKMTEEALPLNCIRGSYARYSNSQGRILGSSIRSRNDAVSRDKMLSRGVMPFLLSTWIMNRETFTKLGGFDKDFFVAQDYEFIFRHLNLGGDIQVLREPMITYLMHAQSETTVSHFQQRLTMNYVRLSVEKKKISLEEYLHVNAKNLKIRRQVKSDVLMRRIAVEDLITSPQGILHLCLAFFFSPIRFLKKIIVQRPHRRKPLES